MQIPENDRNDGQGPVIFVHLPKTGGVTLHQILMRQYFGRDEFVRIGGLRHETSLRDFFDSPGRKRARCVTGHFPFGMHEVMKTASEYVTVLREPVGRIVSGYRYVRAYPELVDYLRLVKLESLDDWVDYLEKNRALNEQTNFLAGHLVSDHPSILEIAKQNMLDAFLVCGTTERFDHALVLMKRKLRWKKSIAYIRSNTQPPYSLTEHSPDTIERIRTLTRMDAELYRFAQELLESQVRKEGISFRLEVFWLKTRNHLLARIVPQAEQILELLGRESPIETVPAVRQVRAKLERFWNVYRPLNPEMI